MGLAIITLVAGLIIGAGLVYLYKELTPPPGSRRPQDIPFTIKYRAIIVPALGAVLVCLLAWVAFGRLFTPPPPPDDTAKNKIRIPLSSKSSPEKSSIPGSKSEKPELLATDSEMAGAAIRIVPMNSRIELIGTRPKMNTVSGEKMRPERPAASAATTRPKPAEAKDPKPTPTTTKPLPAEPAPPTTAPAHLPAKTPAKKTPAAPPLQPASEPGETGLRFTVHLASFSIQDNARRIEKKMKQAGVPAFITRIELDGKQYWRVMVGSFLTRENAQKYGLQIQERGLTEGLGEFQVKLIVSGNN